MVINAMKLFMEINPQLFDDCSHDYTEQQNNADAREALRERKWAVITEQANLRRANGATSLPLASGPSRGPHVAGMPRLDEGGGVDPASEDNQRRLDSLKLQDGERREQRRPTAHERQNSTGSSRSQQR
jgi:serine/threonine-protein phosphatase 2A regulatory subunit B'